MQTDWTGKAQQFQAFAGMAYPHFVQDLEALVNIESESGDVHGSREVADWLKGRLAPLHAQVEERPCTGGIHLIARLAGGGDGRYLLLMHTDTVHPRGALQSRPFKVDELGHAYGPGAGDSKASVVFGLYLAEALQALAPMDYGELLLYFDCEEEIGSADEEAIVVELAYQADLALVLDTARPDWGIVTRRKGYAAYDLEVQGIPGHSGNAPQATASATMELAYQLTALHSLSRPAGGELASPLPGDPQRYSRAALAARGIQDYGQFIPEVSINAGVIGTPNTKLNVVPGRAFARVEVRAYRQADLQSIDQAIRRQAATTTIPGTQVEVSSGRQLPPMEKSEAASKIIRRYAEIARQVYGVQVVEWSAGGITVGNLTSSLIPTVDALAVEVHNEHDLQREYADLNSFAPRLVSLALLIKETKP